MNPIRKKIPMMPKITRDIVTVIQGSSKRTMAPTRYNGFGRSNWTKLRSAVKLGICIIPHPTRNMTAAIMYDSFN